jgi:hypothetical protein
MPCAHSFKILVQCVELVMSTAAKGIRKKAVLLREIFNILSKLFKLTIY